MLNIDEKYVESVAYHEAVHMVVASAQGLCLRNWGLCIDPLGAGLACYSYRQPDGSTNVGPDPSRERTIVATNAGYIAQNRFFPDCATFGAHCDANQVNALLDEMYSERNVWFDAKAELWKRSCELVDRYWPAIDALAKALWAKEWQPQVPLERRWSHQWPEKRMEGEEVMNLLSQFEISAALEQGSAGNGGAMR